VLFLFEDFVLDNERRELRAGGTVVPIEPQVFDVLVYLIENRDRVVSKDDLIASVWGGRIVSESNLTSRINAVRKAVGDSGKEQRLIRTSARKGIRFVGEVIEKGNENLLTSVTTVAQKVQFCTASDGVRIAYALAGQGLPLVKAANWLNHLEYDWRSPIWSHLFQALAGRFSALCRTCPVGQGLLDEGNNRLYIRSTQPTPSRTSRS
jgi:DNA-binding winged helix-turn-helix (wHTH) protein